jgi:hypothetical protein
LRPPSEPALYSPPPRVLANGYSLNHTALAVHAIAPPVRGGLAAFNRRLEGLGFRLNGEGGLVKASADGLLLQSSTVADSGVVAFKEVGGRVGGDRVWSVGALGLCGHGGAAAAWVLSLVCWPAPTGF